MLGRLIVAAGLAASLAACAGTYALPETVTQPARADAAKPKADIVGAAQRVLVGDGYQITAADPKSGIVSTAFRDLRLTPAQADCGTTLGIDYLKDVRTRTRVALGVVASDGHFEVRANIEGEYKPGSAIQNITLTCVSRGAIEHEVARQIAADLS